MANIHETAIVHPGAKLGSTVSVGAYSIIEERVEIGDGTVIEPHVIIRDYTRIGKDNHFYQFGSIGEAPQSLDYNGEPTTLVIGDRNRIRENVTLNRGTAADRGETRIGDDNLIMAYVHIAHDCVIHNHTIFANGTSLAGHVVVNDYAILGGFTLIHQFCKIGAHCITGIGTVGFQDIPPYLIVSGNPAKPHGINTKGLSRRGFEHALMSQLKKAYRLYYMKNLDQKSALQAIRALDTDSDDLARFADFIAASERGIIRR